MNIPKECSKSEFARLLGVDPANVSRWASAKRLDLTKMGRVDVLPSLTRLLATLDPSRGGRDGMRGPGSGGTIDTIRRLLAQAAETKAAPASGVAELEAQLAEVSGQLAYEREWRAANCYHHDEEARLRGQLVDAMETQWRELTAAREAGGDQFERIMFRIELRIYSGMSDEEIARDEALMFDDE